MLKYITALWLYISKNFQIKKIEIEFTANSKVFKEDLERDINPMIKEQMNLDALKKPTKEEMQKKLMFEEQIERTQRLKAVKQKADNEIKNAKLVIEEIKKILIFR